VNVLERDDDALIGRDIDAGYTGHFLSSPYGPAARPALFVDPRPVEAGGSGHALPVTVTPEGVGVTARAFSITGLGFRRLLVFGVPQGEPRAVRQSRLGSP
jgi:hypothetical protein